MPSYPKIASSRASLEGISKWLVGSSNNKKLLNIIEELVNRVDEICQRFRYVLENDLIHNVLGYMDIKNILKKVPILTIHLLSPILCVPKKLTNHVYPSCNTSNQNIDSSISNIPAT